MYESDLGRETDSPLEGDGFELPVPREKGWSFDGSLSSAPFKSLRVSTKTTRFLHEGPMVRIRVPPTLSQPQTGPTASGTRMSGPLRFVATDLRTVYSRQ